MYKVLNTDGYQKLMDKYHISSIAAKYMAATKQEFTAKLEAKNPYDYKDMDKVVSRILQSIAAKKKIAIYGDYDADGICSVSILYKTFKLMNYEVGYYVPNRYNDGYGLSSKIVEQMANKGYSLIICADNGIKAFEAIELAKNKGIEVIVLDHHQKDDILPNYDLCLHPEYSSFTNYNMCAATVCYYLSTALLGYEDMNCLALAGIATIGDVMPLIDNNKYLVNKALNYLNTFKYTAINLLNKERKPYTETLISMQIVPKINSIGRMCNNNYINKLVKFLTSEDANEVTDIASFIEKTNEERKNITSNYFNKLDKKVYKEKVIVEKDDEMLEGINGIIAARFSNKYNLPAIIFSLDETKKFYKGSARSINDYNIIELLKENKYIYQYGGHKGAAGLTVKKEDFKNFKKEIYDMSKDNVYEEVVLEVIEINEDELSYKAYLDLNKFAPYGEGNPHPLFLIKNIASNRIELCGNGEHIKINFNNDTNLIGFNLKDSLKNGIISYDVIMKLEENNLFKNKLSCKCIKLEGNNNA